MRLWGPIRAFDQREEDILHQTMLRILDEVGVVAENRAMLERLAAFGGRVDFGTMKATFSPAFVETFIAESDSYDWESVKPTVGGHAGVYFGYFLDPETDGYSLWTLETLKRYMKVAHHLEHVTGDVSYAIPLENIPYEALVPYFHYLSFCFRGRSAASIDHARYCPLVLEMCQAAAEAKSEPMSKVFHGCVYLISPLKLAREEAAIYVYFAERGLKSGMGHMLSAGGSAPVTLAGAIALNLAQDIFVNMVHRAWFGGKSLGLGCAISPLDMRTLMYPYGRPEKEMCNVAMAQMARRYSAAYGGHCGHTDAKRPSVEAGFQKALNSIPTLMASGRTSICCGLLSVDEVFSPIQMILDDEIVSCLKRFAEGFEVNEETLAFDVIKAVGPGSCFLDRSHTAEHFRSEFWDPKLFSRDMFGGWKRSGGKHDVDRAFDVYHEILKREPAPSQISPSTGRALLKIIETATGFEPTPMEA